MEELTFSSADIASFDDRYRAAFINSLGGFKSVVMVGTINEQGMTNLAIFSSLFHLGSNPPLYGMIVRPDKVYRHTLENIMETGVYTINHLNEQIYKQAHQTSARYDREISEFDSTQLTVQHTETLKAPYVKASKIKFGMQLIERIDLKVNGTILIIGKVIECLLPAVSIGDEGFIDLEAAGTVTLSGLDSYHLTCKLSRLTYAKPDTLPEEIITRPGIK